MVIARFLSEGLGASMASAEEFLPLMQGTYLMLVYSVVKVFEVFASHYLMAEKKKK